MMDYNKLIEQLRSTESRSKRAMLDDAATAIETLMVEAERNLEGMEALKAHLYDVEMVELPKVKAERDAAVADLKACSNNSCVMCKWFDGNNHCTAEEPCYPNDNWEWRGLQKEE